MNLDTGNDDNKYKDNMYNHYPIGSVPITYYTAVALMLCIFILFVLLSQYMDRKSSNYVTKYKNDCLLQMTTSYSGTNCV